MTYGHVSLIFYISLTAITMPKGVMKANSTLKKQNHARFTPNMSNFAP